MQIQLRVFLTPIPKLPALPLGNGDNTTSGPGVLCIFKKRISPIIPISNGRVVFINTVLLAGLVE